MRSLIVLLALVGCVGPPAGQNAATDDAPPRGPAPPQAPAPPGPSANAFRAAIEANEEQFRYAIVARLGEEARQDIVTIRPLEVMEDSRCPVDATCVWAGRVRLRVRVTIGGTSVEPVMEIDRPVTLSSNQQLTLVAVDPLNWAHPPAGVDPRAPKRFAFTLID